MFALTILPVLMLKLLGYSAWCWLGVRWFTSQRPRAPRILGLALLRIIAGLLLGWSFLFVLTFVAPAQNRLGVSIPAMIGGFAVLRWFAWCLIAVLIEGTSWSVRSVTGAGMRSHLWRFGGVALSFATDAGILAGVGVLGLIPC